MEIVPAADSIDVDRREEFGRLAAAELSPAAIIRPPTRSRSVSCGMLSTEQSIVWARTNGSTSSFGIGTTSRSMRWGGHRQTERDSEVAAARRQPIGLEVEQ